MQRVLTQHRLCEGAVRTAAHKVALWQQLPGEAGSVGMQLVDQLLGHWPAVLCRHGLHILAVRREGRCVGVVQYGSTRGTGWAQQEFHLRRHRLPAVDARLRDALQPCRRGLRQHLSQPAFRPREVPNLVRLDEGSCALGKGAPDLLGLCQGQAGLAQGWGVPAEPGQRDAQLQADEGHGQSRDELRRRAVALGDAECAPEDRNGFATVAGAQERGCDDGLVLHDRE
mmetsp:Transcript_112059/g.322080  ORF Transcript_112059/g.322080 Transcript_112059/m.322080 type:complete len:227 (+) Transcript_112059:1338-2018(+)